MEKRKSIIINNVTEYLELIKYHYKDYELGFLTLTDAMLYVKNEVNDNQFVYLVINEEDKELDIRTNKNDNMVIIDSPLSVKRKLNKFI